MNNLSTDVLIIGSGGAGLRAAIEARRNGLNVLLISKSKMALPIAPQTQWKLLEYQKEKKTKRNISK